MNSLTRKICATPVAESAAIAGPPAMLGFVILAVMMGAILAVLALSLGLGPLPAALAFPIGGWLTLVVGSVLIFRRGKYARPVLTSDTQRE